MRRLAEILADPQLGWLVDRLVKRVEQGKPLDSGSVTLSGATRERRRAVDDLLGRRSSSGSSLGVPIAQLGTGEEILRALEELRGPLRNLRAEREAEARVWEALFARWRGRFAADGGLLRCLDSLAGSGLLKRLSNRDAAAAEALLGWFGAVIGARPHGEVLLANLAVNLTGDSHALDRSRPLAALCLHAIRELEGIDGTASAEHRRAAWAALGVVVDDLSAPVLCLNLRAAPGSDLAPPLDWYAAQGEPFFLSYRQIQRFVADAEMRAVHVCENPAIVSEAANRLGATSRALVCLNGVPNSAVKELLRRVAEAGVPLWLRADFDWAGLGFVNQLLHLRGAQTWRMGVEDYLACKPNHPLGGTAIAPHWALELVAAMQAHGCAVFEEELVGQLVEDLRGGELQAPA